MISSGWAWTGKAASALRTMVEKSSLTGGFLAGVTFSQFLQIIARVGDLGSRVVRAFGNCDNFLVIIPGLVLVSRLFGRGRCCQKRPQAFLLLPKRCPQSGKPFRGPFPFKQHDTIEF